MKGERYRVIGSYTATMTVDVMAESMEEAEKKARDVFEAADADDFSIGDEIDVEAYKLYGDEKGEELHPIAPHIDMPDADVVVRYEPATDEFDVVDQMDRIEDAEFEMVNNLLLP